MSLNGREALLDVWYGREALPNVHEWSEGLPGCPGVVGCSGRPVNHSRMSGSCRESLRMSGRPSRLSGMVERPSRMSTSGRMSRKACQPLPDVRELSGVPSDVRKALPVVRQ